MRALFIVVSKICGLWQAYTGLAYLVSVLPMLYVFNREPSPEGVVGAMQTSFHGSAVALSTISILAMAVVTFAIAWVFLFRTEWLADALKLPKSDVPAFTPPALETLLYAGAKLIGLFTVIQGIPPLAQGLFHSRPTMEFTPYMWSTLSVPAIRIAIGVFVAIKTKTVVDFLLRKSGKDGTLAEPA